MAVGINAAVRPALVHLRQNFAGPRVGGVVLGRIRVDAPASQQRMCDLGAAQIDCAAARQ
jgi:hypothetical protein